MSTDRHIAIRMAPRLRLDSPPLRQVTGLSTGEQTEPGHNRSSQRLPPETPFELGYQASWAPSANSGSGLTDGDYAWVTDYTGEVGAYLDGRLGYQMSDTDC